MLHNYASELTREFERGNPCRHSSRDVTMGAEEGYARNSWQRKVRARDLHCFGKDAQPNKSTNRSPLDTFGVRGSITMIVVEL